MPAIGYSVCPHDTKRIYMGNKFRNKLARLLHGRYGADNLYNALFVVELVFLVAASMLSFLGKVNQILAVISIFCYVIALLLLIWTMFRFFSRNITARRRENDAWLRFKGKFRRKPKMRMPADTAEHVFRACPKCCATLRLPRISGKHEAKCPRCGEKFTVKVKK